LAHIAQRASSRSAKNQAHKSHREATHHADLGAPRGEFVEGRKMVNEKIEKYILYCQAVILTLFIPIILLGIYLMYWLFFVLPNTY